MAAALPLAVLGVAALPNEYRAMGLDAIDCDGPQHVFMLAIPALAIYAAIALLAGLRTRRPFNLLVPLACVLICVPLALNVAQAARDSARNAREAAQTCG